MLKIGLTGGIGSGKTTVAKVFETLGIPVYYADAATKRLMQTNAGLKEAIQKNFGEASFKNDKLDTKYLADIVFNDTEKLSLLNALTHPVVIDDAMQWMLQQQAPYAIKEAALIFEAGIEQYLDYVIGVQAPLALRMERVIQRDKVSMREVQKRNAQQMDEAAKMKRCNFIITNDEESLVVPQVLAIHEKLLQL
ncbi:MAG: dephospho-CoA kinase [Chitinophagaceae bacterium]|nr:dephospho-CoA kinase [Chitinophagaceae bacterium]